VEAMAGLRRLSLNDNPDIGDRGVQAITEEARDDLWLRALDLQNTGLTDLGALHIVHLVRGNPNLVVVDARRNPSMSSDSLSEIFAVLAINNADKDGAEYNWKTNASEVSVRKPPKSKPRPVLSLQRCHSTLTPMNVPKWRKLDEVQTNENTILRQQVRDLNDLLNHEVRIKSDLIKENKCLKDEVEKLQKQVIDMGDELAVCKGKSSVSKETLDVLENTLSQLASVCCYEQNSAEIGDLLEEMRTVLRLSEKPEYTAGNSRRRPHRAARHPLNRSNEVIWEKDEQLNSHRSCPGPINKAQDIFAKMIENRRTSFAGRPTNTPCSSGDESS